MTQWMRDASDQVRWAGRAVGPSFACRPRRDFDREVREMLAAAAARVDDDDDDLRGAYHESAHAYVLWRTGMGFDQVELGRHGAGTTTRSAGGPMWDVGTAVAALLAGGAAERVFFGAEDRHACVEDEATVAELLHGRPGRYAQYAERAEALVVEGADAIAFGALALLNRGTVPAVDMCAIFTEHAPRPLDERLDELDAKYHLAPGTCRDLAAGALAELHGDRPTEARSTIAVARPVTADLWPPRARELYQAMHRAGDRGDWATFRELQDELADVQRPLIWSS